MSDDLLVVKPGLKVGALITERIAPSREYADHAALEEIDRGASVGLSVLIGLGVLPILGRDDMTEALILPC